MLFSSSAIGQNKSTSCYVQIINKDTVYRNVDKPPVPKEGYNSLFNIIKNNSVIDNESIEKLGISDVSILFEFIINAKGSIISCSIVEKNEFIQLNDIILNEMMKIEWKPGECDQIKVNSAILLPVNFRI